MLDYIAKQEEHHLKVSFKEELIAFLKKHEIKYTKNICGNERAIAKTFSVAPAGACRVLRDRPTAVAVGYPLSPLRG